VIAAATMYMYPYIAVLTRAEGYALLGEPQVSYLAPYTARQHPASPFVALTIPCRVPQDRESIRALLQDAQLNKTQVVILQQNPRVKPDHCVMGLVSVRKIEDDACQLAWKREPGEGLGPGGIRQHYGQLCEPKLPCVTSFHNLLTKTLSLFYL